MTKKKREKSIVKGLVVGGAGLSLGAAAVGALPASEASAGVLGGMGTAGAFFRPIATIGAAGIVTKQLRELKHKKRRRREW